MGAKDQKRAGATPAGLLWAHRKEVERLTAAGHWLEAADRLEKIAFLTHYQEDREIEQLEQIYRKLGHHRSIQKLLKKALSAALQSANEEGFFVFAAKLAALCRSDVVDGSLPEMLHDLDAMVSLFAKQRASASEPAASATPEKIVSAGMRLKIGFAFGGSFFHPLPVEWYQALLGSYDSRHYELLFYWLPSPGDCSRDEGLGVISQLSLRSCSLHRADSQMSYPRQVAALVKTLKKDRLDCLVFHSVLFAPIWNFVAHQKTASVQAAILAHCENAAQIDLQYLPEALLQQACGPALGVESLGFPVGVLCPRTGAFEKIPADNRSAQAWEQCACTWLEDLRSRFFERFPPAAGAESISVNEEKQSIPSQELKPPAPDVVQSTLETPCEPAGQSALDSVAAPVQPPLPQEADAMVNQAIEALQRGECDHALDLLIKAKALHYPVQDLEYVRGMCHIQKKDLGAALRALAEETKMFPDNQPAVALYAKVRQRLGSDHES